MGDVLARAQDVAAAWRSHLSRARVGEVLPCFDCETPVRLVEGRWRDTDGGSHTCPPHLLKENR